MTFLGIQQQIRIVVSASGLLTRTLTIMVRKSPLPFRVLVNHTFWPMFGEGFAETNDTWAGYVSVIRTLWTGAVPSLRYWIK